jgi:hypothetical protein
MAIATHIMEEVDIVEIDMTMIVVREIGSKESARRYVMKEED